jgi:hypothetical protein
VKNIGLQHISGSALTTMACGEHPLRALTSSKRIRERKSSLGTVTHRMTFRLSGKPFVKQKKGVTVLVH